MRPAVALSLKQPWAYAVMFLGKDVENRTWRRRFRGRVILHASRTYDPLGFRYLADRGFVVPAELPIGAYVGEVTVTDCRPLADCSSPWAFGPWCYLLADPLAYETPVPGRGWLGFYPLPVEIARILPSSGEALVVEGVGAGSRGGEAEVNGEWRRKTVSTPSAG